MVTGGTVHTGIRGRRRLWAAPGFFPELLLLPLLALVPARAPLLRGDLIGRGEIAHEYSVYAFVARAFRTGHLPLWNAYAVSGNPGLADPLANVFYPLTAPLLMLLPVAAAINVMIVVHMVLAGLWMHLYLGGLRLSRPARFLGAVAYMLSGFVAWRILSGDVPRLATYAWIPLLFYIVDDIVSGRRRMESALLGGLVLAWQFFAGDPQTFAYATVALAAYAVFCILAIARSGASRPAFRRAVVLVIVMFVLGAGFASAQALPTLEEFSLSNRAGFGAGFAQLGSVPPVGLVSLLTPRFFGDEIHGWWGETELQAREFYPHAATFYAGFFTLVLAITAIVTRRDEGRVRFFAWLGAAVLWLALGKFGYLYRAVAYVPVFRSFRDIENINVLVPMSASVLAAFGFDRFVASGTPPEAWSKVLKGTALAVASGVILVELAILTERQIGLELLALPAVRQAIAEGVAFVSVAWAVSAWLIRTRAKHTAAPAWLVAAALGFLAADLLYSAVPLIAAGTDVRPFAQPDAVTAYLSRDTSLYRVSGFYDRGPMFGVQDVGGEPSLLLARYQEYTDTLQGYGTGRSQRPEGPHGVSLRAGLNSPLLALLNVKYSILSLRDVAAARLADPSRLVRVDPYTFVYRHPLVYPRVLAPSEYKVLPDADAVLDALRRGGDDPRTTVLLERQPALPPGFGRSSGSSAWAAVKLVSYENDQVAVRATFPGPGFLVLNDVYYPAWRAEIDGRPTPVYRANYLFRAVVVPAGTHEIRFVYRDRMLFLGAGIALLGVLCGITAWAVEVRHRQRS